MAVAGVHLEQHLGRVTGPPRSAVAVVGEDGTVRSLRLAGDDDDVAAAVPEGVALVVVDAPLAVPGAGGRRDVEEILAWCDQPAFPVARRRMQTVFGGSRGEALAPRLAARADAVAETLPDLVLRQLMWERDVPWAAPAMDLAHYRAAWLAVRAPAFRPKGAGRARPGGAAAAHALLDEVLDLAGWRPVADPDDWQAIGDAARIDALACAYAGLRRLQGRAVAHGSPPFVAPAGADLAARFALHAARLAGSPLGAVGPTGDTPPRTHTGGVAHDQEG